jgi:hypothetical protein
MPPSFALAGLEMALSTDRASCAGVRFRPVCGARLANTTADEQAVLSGN